MKVLVTYHSLTGNTEELAKEVAKGVKEVDGVESILKRAEDVKEEDFLEAKAIIAGSPVYFGSMASELKRVFEKFVHLRDKMENKVGAAFATSGDESGGKETTIMSILQAMLIYGMIVVGDPMDATGHYGTACCGRPGDEAKRNARKLGKRVAEVAKKIWS